jgi:hypothetical protein
MIVVDKASQEPSDNSASLIARGPFSLERLLTHIDPGPAEESEAFVREIYEQRRIDLTSDRRRESGHRY